MSTTSSLPWSRIRAASPTAPLRVLFSACMLGRPTGWEGEPYTDELAVRLAALPNVSAIAFCPEDATLGTPRPLTTLHDGHGRDVLAGRARVMDTTGRDVTRELVRGAELMLEVARAKGAELAVLLEISDSCGSHAVYLGDPKLRRYQRGPGVAAATLANAGIPVVGERDLATLGRILAALDPTFTADPAAVDFEDSPWFREYFAKA